MKYGQDKDTCPVHAARTYLAALAAEGHTAGPLYMRIDRWGYLAPPVYRGGQEIGDPTGRLATEAISDVVEKSMAVIGMSGRRRSHSLRRGFATAASIAGADPVRAVRHGGWADNSTAYQGYVQEASGLGDDQSAHQHRHLTCL
ncbi:hypothetical protein [Streptomyces sp. NPDC021969]|uniref:hypothetical protein n=1 Tax=unclassified Streptomyces TaxID=2593676 RepID=UPI0033CBF8CB